MVNLPAEEKSFWREGYSGSLYPELKEDLEVDVAIVGAGITGLTSAYLLKQAGFKVAVLDKDTVGGGTTGRTTGKVSSLHSLIYEDLQKRLGSKTARLYGEANEAAIKKVASIVNKEKIECEWYSHDNYVFTTDPKRVDQFKKEAQVAAGLGLPATLETDIPLPFEIKAAVKFSGQGRIHAQKYVEGLARAVNGKGSYVFENSHVKGIRDGNPGRIRTSKASITAQQIIVATNVPTLPLMARGAYCLLEYPTESYIVAGQIDRKIPGMYISPDDDHYSILPIESQGRQLLLVGGGGHISGMRLSKQKRFKKLANYAEKHFGITEFQNQWCDRDYLTYDGIPLVGKAYPWSKNLYVASAFRKWGLTNGTVAAMILRDLIAGKPNEWVEIYDSTRIEPVKNIPRIAVKHIFG